MTKAWRFIDVQEHPGAYNMELDEQLARSLFDGSGHPTVRLFQWQPWAISLGFNQDAHQVDAVLANADGIDVVRRPTGGRAILHAEELTYSVVMEGEGRTVLEVYNSISTALVRGLQLYGVDVTFSKSQPDFRAHYKNPSSIPCFTASARYEIEWQGRKLVGSAQRRFRSPHGNHEFVLQHGSILLGPAHRRLVDYLILPDSVTRQLLEKELNEKTVDLASIQNASIDVDDLAACIKRGFEDTWGIVFNGRESTDMKVVAHG